jgi:hypothetical protein
MKVKEFKMWLEGVLAFQEDKESWRPTAKQWKTILQKIESLDDEEDAVQIKQQTTNHKQAVMQPQNNEINFSLEKFSENPPKSPSYTIYSDEQLEAMKKAATGSNMIDVPILSSEHYESPFK